MLEIFGHLLVVGAHLELGIILECLFFFCWEGDPFASVVFSRMYLLPTPPHTPP